jgi:hypothetical protein
LSGPVAFTAADQAALEAAVRNLEQPRLAVQLAAYAGKPLDGAIKMLPRANGTLHRTVHKAMLECLTIAIDSRDGQDFAPSAWRAKALTGLTGGVSGFFGGALLPFELPLTITLMLRAISDIASDEGEDLRDLESRMACLQVFALSDRRSDSGAALGYYAARAALSKLTIQLVTTLGERATLDASAPVVSRLVGELVGRFGFVLSERAAASAVPVIGAIGGATLNVLFMDHFERLARGHFSIRRLERAHGAEVVDRLYREAVTRL